MSETTDTLNAGELFESLGKVWTLSHVGPAIRAAYSAWCKLKARRLITENKADLTEEEYADDLQTFQEAKAAGRYNWGSVAQSKAMGSAVRAILRTEEGNLRLVQLLLKAKHGELADAKVQKIIEGADASEFDLALRAALELPVPNAPAPETGSSEITTANATA